GTMQPGDFSDDIESTFGEWLFVIVGYIEHLNRFLFTFDLKKGRSLKGEDECPLVRCRVIGALIENDEVSDAYAFPRFLGERYPPRFYGKGEFELTENFSRRGL